jgi:hypothetical protein
MGANAMSLTWPLVDVAAPQLDNAARTWTCTQIGAGESRAAIENILRVILCLSIDPAVPLFSWLSRFRGSDCEKRCVASPSRFPRTRSREAIGMLSGCAEVGS